MNRVAIDLGIFRVYYYSIFILLGVLSAIFIIYKEAKRQEFFQENFIDLIFNSIIIGFIGARFYYVLFNIQEYLKNPLEIIQIWHGGLAIHGGLIFGGLYAIYFCKKNKINVLKTLDIIVVGIILAQAIGRWGNFFNQEAFGPLTTYQTLKNMHLPPFIINGMKIAGNYYTPTFLYESVWNLLGFILLILLRKRKSTKIGQLSATYLIWYSIGRFYIESLRTDSLMLGKIKVAQLVSIISIIIGIILIIKSKKEKYYNIEKRREKWTIM